MVYKQLAKFENEENYQLAKTYLKKLVRDSEGSCCLANDRDHYETGNQDIKISLNNETFEIFAECDDKDNQSYLEEKLKEFDSIKK